MRKNPQREAVAHTEIPVCRDATSPTNPARSCVTCPSRKESIDSLSRQASVVAVGAAFVVVQRAQSVLVWDEIGDVFGYLRQAKVGASLWRVPDLPARRELAEVDLAI